MNRKRLCIMAIVCASILVWFSAGAAAPLVELEKGLVWEFTRADGSGTSWSHHLTVVDQVVIDGRSYFQVQRWNYDNQGDTEDYYWRVTDDALYAWTGSEDLLMFKVAPAGTSWTSGDTTVESLGTETVTVAYGGPFQAYVFRQSQPGTPYWDGYIVPGLAYVKEVDYWAENPPVVTELVRIRRSDGYDLTADLWAKAVLRVATTPVTEVALVWKQVGTDTTPSGDRVISGYFYADPNDFAYGSQYNPEVFVKIYIATNGWCNMAFNHVTVDDVTIYSAHNYSGTADQTGTVRTVSRLLEHQYSGGSAQ